MMRLTALLALLEVINAQNSTAAPQSTAAPSNETTAAPQSTAAPAQSTAAPTQSTAAPSNASAETTAPASEATTATPTTTVAVTVEVTVPITMDIGVSVADFNSPPAGSAAFAVKKGLCGDSTLAANLQKGDLTASYCEALAAQAPGTFAGGDAAARKAACLAASSTACTAAAARRLSAGRQLASHGGAIKINGEHTTKVVPVGNTLASALVSTANNAITSDAFKNDIQTKTATQVQTSISSGDIAAALTAANVSFPGNASALGVTAGTITAETQSAAAAATTSNAVVASALGAIVMAAFAMLF